MLFHFLQTKKPEFIAFLTNQISMLSDIYFSNSFRFTSFFFRRIKQKDILASEAYMKQIPMIAKYLFPILLQKKNKWEAFVYLSLV